MQSGVITHAIRMTAEVTDTSYLWPARHEAGSSSNPNLPPMGARFRLKASYDISGYSPQAQVVLRAMQQYGLILADNGSNWYFGGTADDSWPAALVNELKQVPASAFEAVDESALMIDPNSGQARQLGVSVNCGSDPGYRMVASDGGVFSFCQSFLGSMGGQHLNAPMVGMAETPGGAGYWEVASDGGIFSYGDATFHGSTGSTPSQPAHRRHGGHPGRRRLLARGVRRRHLQLRRRRASTARPGPSTSTGPSSAWRPPPTATATGSWPPTAASSATATPRSCGSRGGQPLNKPIVGMAASPSGHGYWLVASDGGIFTYGDAGFDGSAGLPPPRQADRGDAGARRAGGGYWLVASDGGIFSYGDAVFNGSTGGLALAAPIVGMG